MLNSSFELVGWTGAVDAIFALGVAWRLWYTYRVNRNVAQMHFLLFFLYIGLFFFCFAVPQLFIDSGIIIGMASVISYFFLYLGLAHLLGFPFQLRGEIRTAESILRVMFVYNVLFFLLRIVFFEPSVKEVFADYTYWRPVFPIWMRILTGVIALAATSYSSYLLFRFARDNKSDRFMHRRGLWLAGGTALLMLAALSGYVVAPTGSAPLVSTATIFVLGGLLVTLRGVLYQQQSQTAKPIPPTR